jgi:hypothetical protein
MMIVLAVDKIINAREQNYGSEFKSLAVCWGNIHVRKRKIT